MYIKVTALHILKPHGTFDNKQFHVSGDLWSQHRPNESDDFRLLFRLRSLANSQLSIYFPAIIFHVSLKISSQYDRAFFPNVVPRLGVKAWESTSQDCGPGLCQVDRKSLNRETHVPRISLTRYRFFKIVTSEGHVKREPGTQSRVKMKIIIGNIQEVEWITPK